MKKLKTRNEYVGCNRKCRFYADEIRATSYDWWNFVNVINGKVIFNWYRYSRTTREHQWAVQSLMKDLNIKIDATINMDESLTKENFKSESLYHYYDLAIKHIVTNHTKRVKKKTIEENKEAIKNLKRTIKELKEIGAEFSFKRMLKIYRSYKNNRDEREEFINETKSMINKIYKDKKNNRCVVIGKNLKHEDIVYKYLDNKISGPREMSYYWFKKKYTYCNLSNALSA